MKHNLIVNGRGFRYWKDLEHGRWGIDQRHNYQAFKAEQRVYLAYHREEPFENRSG